MASVASNDVTSVARVCTTDVTISGVVDRTLLFVVDIQK